ncbi:MAG: hypothetical protein PF961_19885 [Planctomycetota bacterium]|nr:hypothetical protein [Planctomycetota bacterium]
MQRAYLSVVSLVCLATCWAASLSAVESVPYDQWFNDARWERISRARWEQGPWQNCNPGAGGQVQAVDLDPNVPGRVFFSSDMEGAYRSDDNGTTWGYIGHDLSVSDALCAGVESGNSQRVYAGLNPRDGASSGLNVSDDGGLSWRGVDSVRDPIMQVAVHPRDPTWVLAAPGARWRWSADHGESDVVGARGLWVSDDRGANWRYVAYCAGDGRREVWSISFLPGLQSACIGTSAGVFVTDDRGATWRAIPAPPGAGGGHGADVSPDGRMLYASYYAQAQAGEQQHAGSLRNALTTLWVTPLDVIAWQALDDNGFSPGASGRGRYWRPRVDPRSTATEHRLLTANISDREGLWEVSVQVRDGVISNYRWEQILYYNLEREAPRFNTGWEHYLPRSLDWQYSPVSWGRRLIWATAGQTVFCVETGEWGAIDPSFVDRWRNRYCVPVQSQPGVQTWRSRGAQSTYNFDVAVSEPFVITGTADNGVVQSADAGWSWTIDGRPGGALASRSNAVCVVRSVDPPLALAHVGHGFGANSNDGAIYARRLSADPADAAWRIIAGGPDRVAGLGDQAINQLVPDPHRPGVVYVGTRNRGVYVIDDVQAVFAGSGRLRRASRRPPMPAWVRAKTDGLVVDPNLPGRLWVLDSEHLYRGDERGAAWVWTAIAEAIDHQAHPQFTAWDQDGETWLATADAGDAGSEVLKLSRDGGTSWEVAFTLQQALDLRTQAVPWYRQGVPMRIYGLSSAKGEVVLCYAAGDAGAKGKALGIYRGQLAADGSLRWNDTTDNLGYPYVVRSRLLHHADGSRWLYVATRGMGLWRRPVP